MVVVTVVTVVDEVAVELAEVLATVVDVVLLARVDDVATELEPRAVLVLVVVVELPFVPVEVLLLEGGE